MLGRHNCLLVRHMETDWNRQDRYSGQSDEPVLSGSGARQAYELAKLLDSQYTVSKVVCSDLRRARDTACMLAAPYGLVPIIDPRLRELSVGEMDGMTKAEARKRYAEPRLSTRHPEYDFTSIGGESRAQVIARHRAAFEEHMLDYVPDEYDVRLFVGHGTSLRTFLESCGVSQEIVQGGFVPLLYRPSDRMPRSSASG